MEDAEEYCIDEDTDEDKKKARPIIKNAMDLQRLKLEKLMKNPDKPIIIPEPPKEKDFMQTVPTFVRNVMGSSAGAGSGEFHVYRHLRRKEYARQKFIQAKSIREQLDDDYRQKLEQNKAEADAKTAKKRAKRLKKKQKMKEKGKRRKKEDAGSDQNKEEEATEEDDSDQDEGSADSTTNGKDEIAPDNKNEEVKQLQSKKENTKSEDTETPETDICKDTIRQEAPEQETSQNASEPQEGKSQQDKTGESTETSVGRNTEEDAK